MLTAEKEGLRFLGVLPLDPQVVVNGDVGDMGLLDKPDLPITKEFNKIVEAVVLSSATGADIVHETRKTVPARKKRSPNAKMIVIPVSSGKLAPHLGHCEQFAFIETQDGKIIGTEMLTSPVHKPGVLPRWLHDQGADVIIVGAVSERAQELLRGNGIEVVIGVPSYTPDTLAKRYLSNTMMSGADIIDH
jgi:ATP-binding protein involved in chromosome partitioning